MSNESKPLGPERSTHGSRHAVGAGPIRPGLRSRRRAAPALAALASACLLLGPARAHAQGEAEAEAPKADDPAPKGADPAPHGDPAPQGDPAPPPAKSEPTPGPTRAPAEGPAEEPPPGYDTSLTPGLSWDLVAGGIPESGALIEGALGFSGLPRVAYHYSLSADLSVGGMISFDYAYWAPDRAFAGSLLIQAPIRLVLHRTPSMTIGARLDPGVGLFFKGERRSQFGLGILLNAGASIGYTIDNRFIVGGAINLPVAIDVPTGGADPVLRVPLLIGPVFEFHVTPPLALTLDLGIGPHMNTAGGTTFGLRVMGGVVFRL